MAGKRLTITLTGDEYNAVVMSIAAIGGRAFGAGASRDGIDPVSVATNAAVEAFQVLGPQGMADLAGRLGDAAEAAFGANALTTNARETPFAGVLPLKGPLT